MFRNRQEAGEKLALKLKKIVRSADFVVIALLRGGIVLGGKVSDYFSFPLKPLAVKKMGAPLNPELGIGAVTVDRTSYFDENLIKILNISADYKKSILESKYKEAKLLQNKIEENTGNISCKGKNVIIVDDGAATGSTAICASVYAKKCKTKEIILATPVIAKEQYKIISKYFDRVVCLRIADNLSSVSQFYKEFPQITDEEVMGYLV